MSPAWYRAGQPSQQTSLCATKCVAPIGGLRLRTVVVDWVVETGLRMGYKEGEIKNKL